MAANEASSAFISDQHLTSQQIRFVKTIVDYIVKNGHVVNKSVLQKNHLSQLAVLLKCFNWKTPCGTKGQVPLSRQWIVGVVVL